MQILKEAASNQPNSKLLKTVSSKSHLPPTDSLKNFLNSDSDTSPNSLDYGPKSSESITHHLDLTPKSNLNLYPNSNQSAISSQSHYLEESSNHNSSKTELNLASSMSDNMTIALTNNLNSSALNTLNLMENYKRQILQRSKTCLSHLAYEQDRKLIQSNLEKFRLEKRIELSNLEGNPSVINFSDFGEFDVENKRGKIFISSFAGLKLNQIRQGKDLEHLKSIVESETVSYSLQY